MASFPAITNLNSDIVNKIQNTSKETFSGSKPFITLTNFHDIKTGKTINYTSYTNTKFNLKETQDYKERFPPIITGLEVGASGNLGTIRKAKVNIKFASMDQFKSNAGFLKIGNSQLITWGWNDVNQTGISDYLTTAQLVVNNIMNWQKIVIANKYTLDLIVGILVNFNIKMNADATVDVTLEISAPSEIPGYLSLNRKNKESSLDSEATTDSLTKICKALDLDGELNGTTSDEIKAHSVNYTDWTGTVDGALSTVGNSSQEYIQLGFALKQICNHDIPIKGDANTLEFGIDLENAVAMAHPNMISVSENVLFPNRQTMGFNTKFMNAKGERLIIPNTTDLIQKFGPFNGSHEFPEVSVATQVPQNGEIIPKVINDYYGGYIKHIYVSTQFLIDISKGTDTIHDFLQKVVDELNVAGAGLYNLIVKGDASNDKGKEILSIVDLNFIHDKVDEPLPLNLFSHNSRIIDLSLNADLPKEMVGELMLASGKDTTGALGNPGTKLFISANDDPVLHKANNGKNESSTIAIPNAPASSNAFSQTPDTVLVAGTQNGNALPPEPETTTLLNTTMNIIATKWSNLFNLSGPNRIKFAPSTKFGDSGGDSMFGVFKDVSAVKSVYNKNKDKILRNALVPITVNMTVLGIGGITIGTAIKLVPSPAPWLDEGFWQVTNVEHKVDNSNWETMIELKYRIQTQK